MSSLAFSIEDINKKYCSSSINYESIDYLKKNLLTNAKVMVSNELFGELIYSSTAIENSVLTHDAIENSSVGLIRLDGDPEFFNGKNFAEVCVSIKGYVADEDKEKFNSINITKKHCFSDQTLSTIEVKKKTKEQAILKALYDYDARLKSKEPDKVTQLLQRVEFTESGFVPETETYCTKVHGKLVPIEVMAYFATKNNKPENKENDKKNATSKNKKDDLKILLDKNKPFTGILMQGSKNHPILVKIKFDDNSNSFTGTIEFTGLNATKEIIGGVKGDKAFFNETKLVSKGSTSAYIGIAYDMSLKLDEGMNKLQGRWSYGNSKGEVYINLY